MPGRGSAADRGVEGCHGRVVVEPAQELQCPEAVLPSHLVATGIGGASWDGAGPLWYDALTRGGLPKDADFTAFARATLAAAIERHGEGSAQHGAVAEAWRTVGVLSAGR